MRILLAAGCVLLSALLVQAAAAESAPGLQMLPPTVPGGGPCSFGSNQILTLNDAGTTAEHSVINCNANVTLDSSGNLSVYGTENISGANGGYAAYDRAGSQSGATVFYRSGGTDSLWDSAAGNVINFNGAGNVGIGIAPTGNKLEINGVTEGDNSILSKGGAAGFYAYDRNGDNNAGVFYRQGDVNYLWDNVGGDVISYNGGGNVTISNSLQIGGSTPLTSISANMLANLQGTPVCGANQALTKNGTNSFSCVAVTDIQNVGTTMLPDCAGNGTILTSNGDSFSCVAQTPVPAPSPSYWSLSGATLYNNSGSQIGVGLANPAWQLDVNGDIAINGVDVLRRDGSNAFLYPWGSGYSNGNVIVGGGSNTNLVVTGTFTADSEASATDYCINGVGCSRAPVPRNFSCPGGQVVNGFDGNGSPTCAPAAAQVPAIVSGSANGSWALSGNGAFYSNATATCPSGYIATGGGGYCDASMTGTALIYSMPQGNNQFYVTCGGLSPGSYPGGNGATAYVYCMAQ